MTVAGWTPANQTWEATIFGWRTEEAADARFADPRIEELLYDNPHVRDVLTESGISLIEAWKRGVRYIRHISGKESVALLKPEFGSKRIPAASSDGLVIPHFALDGKRSLQYRPNTPYVVTGRSGETTKPRKYDWGNGGSSGISIGYNAALRLADGGARRLVIVEGTKQAIVADIYAPEDVAVVGIQGIWNGQKEGELLEDLDKLARQFHRITLIPDGDVVTNSHVWDGVELLCELLWEAAVADLTEALEGTSLDESGPIFEASAERAPKVVILPSDGKDGLDDLLGRLDDSERAAFVAQTLATANEMNELPSRPGGSSDGTTETKPEENIWQRVNATVDASLVVETLHGGTFIGNEIELAEGTLTVGRFDRGTGPEFVKTTSLAVARLLGIQPAKVATASTLLVGAVGGKTAYRIISKFDGVPDALVEWLEEHAENLASAGAKLSAKTARPKPDALRTILVAANGDIDTALALIKEAHTQETNR